MQVKEENTLDEILNIVAERARKEKEAERKLRRAVQFARRNGASWQDLAEALGTTRQSAWQRFKETDR
jgi:hypothetical protein